MSKQKEVLLERKEKIESKIEKLQEQIERLEKKHLQYALPTQSVSDIGFFEIQGKRATMEDGHCIIDCFRGNKFEAYFGVYDGHSGADKVCGRCTVDYVQDHLHQNFVESLESSKSVKDAFIKALKKTDYGLKIYNAFGNGSTVAMCYLTEIIDRKHNDRKIRKLFCANCGDSRIILSRERKAIRLTTDHKASWKVEKERLEGDGATIVRGRVLGNLAVSRAMGDHSLKRYVCCDPYYTEVELNKMTDELLIIACDGVWDVFEDQDVVSMCLDMMEEGFSAQEMSKKIVESSLENGSNDNITCVIVLL